MKNNYTNKSMSNLYLSTIPFALSQLSITSEYPPLKDGTFTGLKQADALEIKSCKHLETESVSNDTNADDDKRKQVIGAITLVIALVIHTSLEGFAFGIQVVFS